MSTRPNATPRTMWPRQVHATSEFAIADHDPSKYIDRGQRQRNVPVTSICCKMEKSVCNGRAASIGAQLFSIKYFDGSQENVARNAGDPRHREWKECVEIEDSDIEAGFNAMTKPRAGQASRQICDANAANWVQQNMGAKQADRCDALVIAVDRIFIQTFEALLLLGADIHAIGRCGISASEKVQNSKSKHMKELLNMWRPNHKLHLIDNGHRSQRAARKTRDEQLVIDMVVPNLGSPGLTKKAPKKAAKKTSRLRKQRQNKKRPYVKQQISTAASEPGLMICEPSDWSETTHLHSPSVWPITPTTGSSGDLLSDQLIMGDEVVVQSQSQSKPDWNPELQICCHNHCGMQYVPFLISSTSYLHSRP